MSSRSNHTGRPVGRMDAPADKRTYTTVGPRPGFVREAESREDWRDRAACRWDRLKARGISPAIFFPISFTAPEGVKEAEQAKRICAADCPVRRECLVFADTSGSSDGVFGGLHPDERRSAKRKAARARAKERGEEVADDEPEPSVRAVGTPGRGRNRDAAGHFAPDADALEADLAASGDAE